jgi:DNA-binding NarL/FixJ family response regulator
MRILLADDHALFRDGVASLLRAWGHEVVGQAGSADDAIRLAAELAPDLVLMDVRMPGSGISATRAIRNRDSAPPVVMLTVSDEEDDLFEAIKAGAQGYLLKNLEGGQLRSMLEAVERGEPAITPSTAFRIVHEYRRREAAAGHRAPAPRPSDSADADQLTDRELEVLALVTAGRRNKAIAVELGITENTVKFHLRNILDKLHAQSRAEVAGRAVREGLLPPEERTTPD